MTNKIFFLALLCFLNLNSFCQDNNKMQSIELINQKDSEVVSMVRFYIKSNFKEVAKLFPQYKNFISEMSIIKTFARSKKFEMRPNYLNSRQGEKTDIVLTMSNDKYEITGLVITFTSNKIDSKIESVKRDKKFDQKPERIDEIREL